MSYQGSEAPRYDYLERARQYEVAPRPSFDVVDGGGADARVRRGVTTDFIAYVRLVALAIAVFVALGSARVALTTSTVNLLQSNLQVKNQIEEAVDLNSALRIERSVLSNTARITRIATQNYGMVHAESHDYVTIVTAEEQVEQGTVTVGGLSGMTQQTGVSYSTTTASGQLVTVVAQSVDKIVARISDGM